ncbi:MAG: SAM-dependent methyltransferase, partial [Bdellovibrionales bacterium]
IEFLAPLPKAPLGSFTLFDEKTLVYSAECTSPFPDGEPEFAENKTDPPSRAYLKLWEIFLLTQNWPKAGQTVIDLGSSPGGWTWVLDQLGCNVISVDKAPLAEDLKLSNRVKFVGESAFGLEPVKVDWLFSDVICYPERLLELVLKWRAAGAARNFVCTLKFQGPTDLAAIKNFLAIPGSQVVHLNANKHELTWFLIGDTV